jgi:hypothetical protein
MRRSELNLLIIVFIFLVVIYTLSNLTAPINPVILLLYLVIYFMAIALLLNILLRGHI